MSKNKHLLLWFLCLAGFSYGQDQIFKKDNTKIEAKILKNSPTEIKYKLFSNSDGDTLTVLKKDISIILYENGEHQVINPPESNNTQKPKVNYVPYARVRIYDDSIKNSAFKKLTSAKNLISINLLDFLNGSVGLSYIREFPNKHFHLYVPVSVGFSTPRLSYPNDANGIGDKWGFGPDQLNDLVPFGRFSVDNFKYERKSYDVGLGIHFQTGRRNGISYFVGPYVGMSQFTGTYTEITTVYTDPSHFWWEAHFQEKKFILTRTNFLVENGILYRVNKNFNITFLVGVGYHSQKFAGQDLTKANNFGPGITYYMTHKFSLSFGYRF